jgi:AraC family transcriptional regulator
MSITANSGGGGATELILDFVEPSKGPERHQSRAFGGFAAEYVRLEGSEGFSFRRSGYTHYLAIHDIQLTDGEIEVDGLGLDRSRDLRNAITFIPSGCGVAGWSEPVRRSNTFTALTIDPSQIREDLEARYAHSSFRPHLYFRDAALQSTLLKLQALLIDPDADDLHLESVCVLAAVEILKVERRPEIGRLSARQLEQVLEFVAGNLTCKIELQDLAAVAGLSRFHFSRLFKRTTGQSPYDFVLEQRVRAAATALASTTDPVEAIAPMVGFRSASQLARAFRQTYGRSPQAYRRSIK